MLGCCYRAFCWPGHVALKASLVQTPAGFHSHCCNRAKDRNAPKCAKFEHDRSISQAAEQASDLSRNHGALQFAAAGAAFRTVPPHVLLRTVEITSNCTLTNILRQPPLRPRVWMDRDSFPKCVVRWLCLGGICLAGLLRFLYRHAIDGLVESIYFAAVDKTARSISVSGIVGAVIGGLGAILGICVAILAIRGRKRRRVRLRMRVIPLEGPMSPGMLADSQITDGNQLVELDSTPEESAVESAPTPYVPSDLRCVEGNLKGNNGNLK